VYVSLLTCHIVSDDDDDDNILQGSVVTCFRCGGIFKYRFTANLPLNVAVKKLKKRSVITN